MPVYNGERFLSQALASIWQQTFTDFELLVVDDGSTDRTSEILDACRDRRLRILRNETRLKLAGALNRGLTEARGQLIARMDADDLMRKDRLARQVEYMTRHPEVGCCGGWAKTFGAETNTVLRFPSKAEDIRAFCLFFSPFAHPAVMFRRDWFSQEELHYDGSYYPTEDYELWARAVMRFPCGNIPRVLIDYRQHEKSMTGAEWSEMNAQTRRVQRGVLETLGLTPTEEELHIHRAASMGQLPASEESFHRTEAWLLKIAAANRESTLCSPSALESILNYVWFRSAMGAMRELQEFTWRFYEASHLASIGDKASLHRWVVRFAALKAKMKGWNT